MWTRSGEGEVDATMLSTGSIVGFVDVDIAISMTKNWPSGFTSGRVTTTKYFKSLSHYADVSIAGTTIGDSVMARTGYQALRWQRRAPEKLD